ncbi:MAG: hypothetical protein L3K09_04855, partial [Thermoplasmata archaeon]|nr:hypothetical protein [Thermoplasmata archaeon]
MRGHAPLPSIPAPPPLDEADVREWQRATRRRRPVTTRLSPELTFGLLLLAIYGFTAIAALIHFGSAVDHLPVDNRFVNIDSPPGPSLSHPFGVMRVVGVGVMIALIEATPWDLALVGGILLSAAAIGVLAGAFAGLNESGALDTTITTWSDSVTAIPPFFLVVLLFLGVIEFVGPPYYLLEFALLYVFVLWPYYARVIRARA